MPYPSYSPVSIQHINIVIPNGSIPLAKEFYGEVLGFDQDPVPPHRVHDLLWMRIGDGPQQIHIAPEEYPGHPGLEHAPLSSRHPCFSVASLEALHELQLRIHQHRLKGLPSSARECDEPKDVAPTDKMSRFFARDYAGNKLEFNVQR